MRINKFVEIKHSSLVCLEFCSFASRIRILISLTVCLTFRPFTLRPTLCCSSVVWKAIWNSINAPESIFNALKVCLWYFLRQVPGTDVNRRGVGRGLRPRRRRRPFCSSAAAAPNSGMLPMIVGGKISSLSSPHENRPSRSVPEGPERAEKKGRFSSWSTLNSNWIFQSYHCYYVPSGLFHHVWPNSDCKRWKIELERA